MPQVLDRPEVTETRPPPLQPAPPPPRPIRTFRWLRWVGWMLAAGAVALVVFISVNAGEDAVTIDARPDFQPPVLIAPAVVDPAIESQLGFGEEATVAPVSNTRLVEHAPGHIAQPDTSFMDEATVTPGLTTIVVPQIVIDDPPRLTPDYPSVIRTKFPANRAYDVMAAEYEAFLIELITPVEIREIPWPPQVAL